MSQGYDFESVNGECKLCIDKVPHEHDYDENHCKDCHQHPCAPGCDQNRIHQYQRSLVSELETLKAQLANVEANLRTAEGNWELALDDRDQEIVRRRKSEAQVRELRELLTRLLAECRRLQTNTFDKALPDFALSSQVEAALRSAPPSAPTSALTADVAQNMRFTAGSWYAQLPLAKTNAGEERKDLARQGCTDETRNDPAAGKRPIEAGAEQVPAAPRNKADSSVGDGVVTTEHLEDSQGAIPAEDKLSPSRLRSKSGSAHCSSKAGLGGETAPTADGLSPQDSPSRSEWISVEKKTK